MNRTCITSEDPAALTVTKLYDENNDFGHFWDRNDPTIPLPPCSNVSDDSQCSVCLDQLVKVVCRNLTAGVKIFMEGPEGSINYNQTGCAEPPSLLPTPLRSHLPAIISVICFILIFILGVLWKCCQKTSSSSRTFSCFFNQNRKENVGKDRPLSMMPKKDPPKTSCCCCI